MGFPLSLLLFLSLTLCVGEKGVDGEGAPFFTCQCCLSFLNTLKLKKYAKRKHIRTFLLFFFLLPTPFPFSLFFFFSKKKKGVTRPRALGTKKKKKKKKGGLLFFPSTAYFLFGFKGFGCSNGLIVGDSVLPQQPKEKKRKKFWWCGLGLRGCWLGV